MNLGFGGPLFQAIMVDQFSRLRAGDRFFYQNESWNSDEARIFQQAPTLAKVIEANTNVTNLPSDVFFFGASIGGTVSAVGGRAMRGHATPVRPLAGVTVELEDASGAVLAATVTDAQGSLPLRPAIRRQRYRRLQHSACGAGRLHGRLGRSRNDCDRPRRHERYREFQSRRGRLKRLAQ
jgi:hypothetical protein